MRACLRILQVPRTQSPRNEHPATSPPMHPIVPLVTRECRTYLVPAVPRPTQAWDRLSHPLLADQSTAQTTTILTCRPNTTIMPSRLPTFLQNQVPPRKCGLVQGRIKVGCRCSHGHRATKTWVEVTGTVGILRLCHCMGGPIQADQREFLQPTPRGRRVPVSLSQPLLHLSIPLRAVPRRVTRRLLFSLSRFHPSTMVVLRQFQGIRFQGDRTHPCNNHTVLVRLLPLVHTNRRRELDPSPFLPVNLYLLTLTHSRPPHHPPLDQGEGPRKCGTGQGRDRRFRSSTTLSS